MDLNRVLGALIGGAVRPPRRRARPGAGSLLGGRSREAQVARALAGVAGAAFEAWMRHRDATPEASRPPGEVDLRRPAGQPRPAVPARRPWEGATPPTPTPPAAAPAAEAAEDLLLVRAMVAAAKADGRVDAAERAAISSQLDAAGLSAEERDFVLADFDKPLSPEALGREARDPMLAARLYAAAFAAAGEVSAEERAWLDRLARALRLDKAAVAAIEERLAAA